jgi:hypothetical protein
MGKLTRLIPSFPSFQRESGHSAKAKMLVLALALVLSSAPAAWAKKAKAEAQEATPTPAADTTAPQSDWYLGLGTGADLPGSNWNSNYFVGGGAEGFLGCQFDKSWAAQLALEEWFYTGGGSSLYNLRVLAEAKYAFGGDGWQPYLLAGPGLVFQTFSPTGDNTANFDALAGVGAQFDLAAKTRFYIEAKYNFIMSQTTTFTDLPVAAGLSVGL